MAVRAQEFKLSDAIFQVHGYVAQGFVDTNQNNWLTMNTSTGSFAMTDGAINISTQITDKFRVGAQVYDRSLGQLGRWHPDLDWADAQYRFTSWLGIRGGKVKTVMGLFNDTQDLDFLRPFALLPQSVYPTDLRDTTIAHDGGDLFGDIRLGKQGGTLSYTAYAGHRENSNYGGYHYLLSTQGIYSSLAGLQYGADLRWATPLKGLLVGISRLNEDMSGSGTTVDLGPVMPFTLKSKSDWTNQFYGRYTWNRLEVDSEYRRYYGDYMLFSGLAELEYDVRGWYLAGSYRIAKHLQLGSYYSRYSLSTPGMPNLGDSATSGHDYDKVITARVDLNRFMNIKVEGHFMDGYGVPEYYPNGFYAAVNPQGLKPKTNALVLRTGFNF